MEGLTLSAFTQVNSQRTKWSDNWPKSLILSAENVVHVSVKPQAEEFFLIEGQIGFSYTVGSAHSATE